MYLTYYRCSKKGHEEIGEGSTRFPKLEFEVMSGHHKEYVHLLNHK